MFAVPRLVRCFISIVMVAGLIAVPALAARFIAIPDDVAAGLESRSSRFDVLLVRPDADLHVYSRVAIRTVVVVPLNKEMAEHMTAADREDLVSTFRRLFASGLGDKLAEDVGEGTLVLSAAITRPCPSRSFRSRHLRRSTGAYSPGFEAVLTDGVTGKVVAVIADIYVGSSYSCWGDARKGFRRWGRDLGRELGRPVDK